jgi:hypothetical protein
MLFHVKGRRMTVSEENICILQREANALAETAQRGTSKCVLLVDLHQDDKVKWMGRACNTHRKEEECSQNLVQTL